MIKAASIAVIKSTNLTLKHGRIAGVRNGAAFVEVKGNFSFH